MDGVVGVELVQLLVVLQVPKHGLAVAATGSAQGAIGRHGDGVKVAGVANQVHAEPALVEVPNLHKVVPAARHDGGVGHAGREAHARNPILVAILFAHGELAFAEGVPQLDGAVARTGHDLAVVRRESNGKNVLGVADEAAGGFTLVEIPKAEGTVPRARQGKVAVHGQSNILHEVGVAVEGALGGSNDLLLLLVDDGLIKKTPLKKGLVARSGHDDVRGLGGSGDGSHPVPVSDHDTTKNEIFSHFY